MPIDDMVKISKRDQNHLESMVQDRIKRILAYNEVDNYDHEVGILKGMIRIIEQANLKVEITANIIEKE